MSYKLVLTITFEKELKTLLKKYPSLKEDIKIFSEVIIVNPLSGISIGHNCYKFRLSIKSKGKGKSGGARIITCVKIQQNVVYLLSIYDKSEHENIREKMLIQYLKISGLL